MCPCILPTRFVVDASQRVPLDLKPTDETAGRATMRIEERQSEGAAGTSDQILGEIRDYCRETRTAESTFGRLVVNDGKLVSRLRDGAKITTGTLDKVRTYLSEHRTASPSAQSRPSSAVRPLNGGAATAIAPPGFRFFDNRQKYLLFV